MLQKLDAKIAKVEAIIRRTTARNVAGVDRYRREYLRELRETRNQLIRDLK